MVLAECEAGEHRQLHVTVGQQQGPPDTMATVKLVLLSVLHLNLLPQKGAKRSVGIAPAGQHGTNAAWVYRELLLAEGTFHAFRMLGYTA